MKLYELQALLEGVQYQAAVYDEVVAHLQKCLEEGTVIPVGIGDGIVPEEHVQEVLARLKAQRSELIGKLDIAEDVEVTGVDAEDFALG